MKFTQVQAQMIKRYLLREYKIDLAWMDILYMKTCSNAAATLLQDYGHVVFGTATRDILASELQAVIE
jgi:hypothetical protein